MFDCGFCNARYKTRLELNEHLQASHSENVEHKCFCDRSFNTVEQLAHHQRYECQHPHSREPRPDAPSQNWTMPRRKSALENHVTSVFIPTYQHWDDMSQPQPNNQDPLLMPTRGRALANRVMAKALANHPNLKITVVAMCWFNRPNQAPDERGLLHRTRGFGALVHNMESFQLIYDRELERAARNIQNFEERGSGFTIASVPGFWLNIFKFKPLQGGSFIPTPASIKSKKAVVNLRNMRDHNCLKHALTVGLMYHYEPDMKICPNKPSLLDPLVAAEIDMTGLDLPILVADLPKVEKNNPRLAINCLVMHEQAKPQDISVIHVSPRLYQEDVIPINLLLVYNDQIQGHYIFIRKLDGLVSGTKFEKRGAKWCIKCQQFFSGANPDERNAKFKAHLPCTSQVTGRLKFPRQDIEFKRFEAQMRTPFVVYGDFESKLVPIQEPIKPEPKITPKSQGYQEFLENLAFPEWHSSPTEAREGTPTRAQASGQDEGEDGEMLMEQHQITAYCLKLVGPSLKHDAIFAFTGPGVKEQMIQDWYNIKDMIDEQRADPDESEVPMHMTAADEDSYQAATECFLCHEPFGHPYLVGRTPEEIYDMKHHPDKKERPQSTHPHRHTYVPSFILKGPKVRDHNHDTGMEKFSNIEIDLI